MPVEGEPVAVVESVLEQLSDVAGCRIVVTGCSGFIGKHLLLLLGKKPQVTVVATSRTEIKELPANATWVASPDLTEDKGWSEILKGADVVIHLAGRAHQLREDASNPLEEFRRVNTRGTVSVASAALVSGVRRFVFVSSIGVHGTHTVAALTPSSPTAPIDDYAISKYEAEELLIEKFSGSAASLIIVRPPMVYGMDAPGNFQRLMGMVRKKIPLPFGCTRNRRSLVSVSNLATILWLAATRPVESVTVILPCDGEPISTGEMVAGIAEVLGVQARLLPIPTGLMLGVASALGKRRAAVKVLGDFEINPIHLRELGWEPNRSFKAELESSVQQHT